MDEVECVVVGAGVVGLAVGRALANAGREVLVIEAEDAIGTQTSSRNSEVIHAGIYYPAGSLMARFCVAGKLALYEYCAERGVPFSRCGKLIVAADEAEREKLGAIIARAAANGVDDLVELTAAEAQALEPSLQSSGALLSPSTGIIDSHAYMLALQGDLEAAGGMVVFSSPLVAATPDGDGLVLSVGGAEPMQLRTRLLINSAGLFAPAVARTIAGLDPAHIPTEYYAKGNYFTLSGRSPFSRLIYPVPVPGGLGTHLTIDLGGQARFGPDVEWIDAINYDVDTTRMPLFVEAVKRYWPEIDISRLQPGYSGIRPKIVPKGAPGQDFVVQDQSVHGIAGLINLFGIESPGLTASLALADHVAELAGR
ncbi:FAD-dependent oxidoreductase [Kaistia sp. 32K]|uniref:NAD(P)/FAD-dependent oxidoreductase n=1 Tax=Kaistia sp. 32K TaxID=2795690 RepID=UPI0019153822|nr:NAD(P)/FAD-dependent oxidoreductase [Kaistia sp. 32K]BCP54802.1 FAD-dependent oxidoreductase [Kaistia sp. 32K]